jgi:integrase
MKKGGQEQCGGRHERGLFERPKGSGVWWVRYVDEHGRLHREKVGPKGLALKVYQKRKTQVQERRFFPERIRRKEVLVADMIDDYLARVKGRMRSYVNWKRYAKNWKAALAGKTLRAVSPGDVERRAARLRDKGLADTSVNRELTFLRCLFNVAIADGKADTNPVLRRFFVKENNQRVRYLKDEEERKLCEAVGETEWPKVAFALLTGFRQGNQFRLRWTDVNFDAGTVCARRSKSGEDYIIPMSDDLRALLSALPSRLRSEWVFPSETGATALGAKNCMHRVFVPAVKRAGIEDFRWHDLRHTFASRLVMAGVDIRTVQELMGHKTLAMTMRYAHLSAAHKLDAVQRLNRPKTEVRTDTTTDTETAPARVAVGAPAEVAELPKKESEPCWIRTNDPLLKRQMLCHLS